MDGRTRSPAAEPRRGTRHAAPTDQRTASTYILGVICPALKGAVLVLSRCNTIAMNLHLAEIAQAIEPGSLMLYFSSTRPIVLVASADHSAEHHYRPAATEMPRPIRSRMSGSTSRKTDIEPRLPAPHKHPRCLEHAHRPALDSEIAPIGSDQRALI